jgi:nucleotide-binding universal stress UspA family protein
MTNPSASRLSTIVVGVDDSPESIYALELAATIGAPQRAALTIVHVRPRLRAFGFGPAGSIEYAHAEDELDQAVTAEASGRLAGYPGTWKVEIRSGSVGHELLAVADRVEADLVVLGHRSHGTVHDAILGSSASSTVHHSRRSVLVAIAPS